MISVLSTDFKAWFRTFRQCCLQAAGALFVGVSPALEIDIRLKTGERCLIRLRERRRFKEIGRVAQARGQVKLFVGEAETEF
jgi:hypothetical protein